MAEAIPTCRPNPMMLVRWRPRLTTNRNCRATQARMHNPRPMRRPGAASALIMEDTEDTPGWGEEGSDEPARDRDRERGSAWSRQHLAPRLLNGLLDLRRQFPELSHDAQQMRGHFLHAPGSLRIVVEAKGAEGPAVGKRRVPCRPVVRSGVVGSQCEPLNPARRVGSGRRQGANRRNIACCTARSTAPSRSSTAVISRSGSRSASTASPPPALQSRARSPDRVLRP